MPSLETTHPNCDAANPGATLSAPFLRPAQRHQSDGHSQRSTTAKTQRTPRAMTKRITQTPGRGLSRRQLLKATGGTAALLAAARLNFPAGAFAQGAGPEVTTAKPGFIALSDAGPLL